MKILIAEGHGLFSIALRTILPTESDFELIEACDNGPAAIAAIAMTPFDVVLIDIAVDAAFEITKQIKNLAPSTKILVLATSLDSGTLRTATESGADGILSKDSTLDSLIQAVRDVMAGRKVMDPKATRPLAARPTVTDGLTDEELAILEAFSSGKSLKRIAEEFHISDELLLASLKTILEKLVVPGTWESSLGQEESWLDPEWLTRTKDLLDKLRVRPTWEPSLDPDPRPWLVTFMALGIAALWIALRTSS
jgi:two-component system response regulator DesR